MATIRLLLCLCIVLVSSVSSARNLEEGGLGIKAVNLGGWLVTEGWIQPSLFDNIVNNDLLDGTKLQFESVTTNYTYLSAEQGGGSIISGNRTTAGTWETFRLWRVNASTFQFRADNGKFVGLNGYNVVAVADAAETPPMFQIERKSGDQNRVRIKAENGKYIQVKTGEAVTADAAGDGGWGDDDPTVFKITVVGTLRGEYQVTNGYGPTKAPEIMKNHWDTFIREDDFRFMKVKGLNAVRIPVGWWIALDSNPPPPYVRGSLNALDNAFKWANTHDLKVIIDLHAAKGSQNDFDHSSSRDGSQEWGMTDESMKDTVDVIDFLTARYAKDSCLYAVELLNEPRGPRVSTESLSKYYRAGYDAVRKHSSEAYVIMSTRIGGDPAELLSVAAGMDRVVIDVHYYNLYAPDFFTRMNAEENIKFVYENRRDEINSLTVPNGPSIFVGEWSAQWEVQHSSKEDQQRYVEAQVEVFGRASFGWAFWTFRNVEQFWSMEKMINEGYINL